MVMADQLRKWTCWVTFVMFRVILASGKYLIKTASLLSQQVRKPWNMELQRSQGTVGGID